MDRDLGVEEVWGLQDWGFTSYLLFQTSVSLPVSVVLSLFPLTLPFLLLLCLFLA